LFFFQAEDGIRDFHVTGVQTCALPILKPNINPTLEVGVSALRTYAPTPTSNVGLMFGFIAFVDNLAGEYYCNGIPLSTVVGTTRSEERRVGKAGGYGNVRVG